MKHLQQGVLTLLLAVCSLVETDGFSSLAPTTLALRSHRAGRRGVDSVAVSTSDDPKETTPTSSGRRRPKKKPPKRQYTLAELSQDVVDNPAKYTFRTSAGDNQSKKKQSTYRRTRRKVDQPQQTYLYAAQRRELEREGKLESSGGGGSSKSSPSQLFSPLEQARELGLLIPQQLCDAATGMDDPRLAVQPTIVGKIRVSDGQDSSSMAYLIDKPPGWAIIGKAVATTETKTSSPLADTEEQDSSSYMAPRSSSSSSSRQNHQERVRLVDEDGKAEVFEYNTYDVFDLMTDEEIEEFVEDGGKLPDGYKRNKQQLTWQQEEFDPFESLENNEEETVDGERIPSSVAQVLEVEADEDDKTAANLRRIQARNEKRTSRASFQTRPPRPSLVAWLKDHLAKTEGRTIRGGNFWTAAAGATGVDDSGLVLVCPKTKIDQVFVEYAKYVAVVGNGGFLASNSSLTSGMQKELTQEEIKSEIVAKLRTARDDDIVQTVRYMFPERKSTCDNVVRLCQEEFKEGVRGDFAANPFDRRARRRLIHCESMSVASLAFDDAIEAGTAELPDDIAVLAERRNGHQFRASSFLGRSALGRNPLTNAYREINGAADGYPGWIVDRYDKWLLVQHDPMHPQGPLPSIHDGNTAGVYYLEAKQDRSTMGASVNTRPRLIEGQHAPDSFPVLENGIKYMVSLDRDLSTGLFLDQRSQRAWLALNCHEDTHVLNCFAHTGAYSVAAATAGATTVSLDLSKKWLDRLPLHLEANGIPFDELHDAIYGDCFDWLAKLAKRGEKYDIVILDPPSSSVGRKKRRWSVKNDMHELVALAAVLVKKGGLLWTTTNSASMNPIKFARSCEKGFAAAGIQQAKLERVQPMPVDFPVVGSQPVKNFVWRIP